MVVLLLLSVQNCQFKTNICLWLEGFYNFNFMINFYFYFSFSSFSNLFPSLTCYDSLDMILYLSILVCQINLCLFLLSFKTLTFPFYSLFCTFVNFQVTIYDLLMNNYERQVCFWVCRLQFWNNFSSTFCSFTTINFQIIKKPFTFKWPNFPYNQLSCQ